MHRKFSPIINSISHIFWFCQHFCIVKIWERNTIKKHQNKKSSYSFHSESTHEYHFFSIFNKHKTADELYTIRQLCKIACDITCMWYLIVCCACKNPYFLWNKIWNIFTRLRKPVAKTFVSVALMGPNFEWEWHSWEHPLAYD